MSDWKSLFMSDDFRAYRRNQAQVIAKQVQYLARTVANNGNPVQLARLEGVLTVMNSLLRLPESLTDDEKLQENLRVQLEEDIGNITQYLMREALREQE